MREQVLKALESFDSLLTREQSHRTLPDEARLVHDPYSQLAYVQRLRTFHWSWASRPAPCDIITCARFGWVQVSKEGRVELEEQHGCLCCTACGAQLYLAWDDDLAAGAETILAEEYFAKISKDGHRLDGHCPWTIVPCPDEVMTMPQLIRSKVREETEGRCESFRNVSVASIAISEERLSDLLDRARPYFSADLHAGVLLLGLLGWTCGGGGGGGGGGERGGDPSQFSCQLGCCEYPIALLEERTFDPVAGHAWFCPFVYGTQPAWINLIATFSSRSGSSSGARKDDDGLDRVLRPFTRRRVAEILGANK